MKQTLTIVGASARAAAQSAVRAGYQVVAGDLFADADLARICQATAVDNYPQGLASVVAGPQPGPWMYTGALENSPRLVAQMSSVRPLLGNDVAVLERIRNPWLVADVLRSRGLRVPAIAPADIEPARDGRWIRKPVQSAGGAHVALWDGAAVDALSGATYFQQRITGTTYSAVYLGANGRSLLLGVTRQLVGEGWCGAHGFRYCGSIGPIVLQSTAMANFQSLGRSLASHFRLHGLFGVDAVVNEQGVWPLEVNPRYTASCEILDRGCDRSTVAMHVDACATNLLPERATASQRLWGKAIIFSPRRATVGPEMEDCRDDRKFADVPRSGSVIESGWPIVTVLAEGDDEIAVIARLHKRSQQVARAMRPFVTTPTR